MNLPAVRVVERDQAPAEPIPPASVLDKLSQRRHLGESGSHLRGERGDPYLGSGKLHALGGDAQPEGLW